MADPGEEADVTRADRFIKTAVAILGETGRTDFTVQEVVARSKTSLRAFYQHFSSKDELLLALFDRTIAQSVRAWRTEATGLDSTAALKLVIDRVSQPAESSTQDSLNRALSLYNQHLAETRPREYARVLSPLHQLIRDIVGQGITEGVFNPGLDVGPAAAIVMQTVVGAQRLHWLGSELNGTPIDTCQLYDFCSRALGIRDSDDGQLPGEQEFRAAYLTASGRASLDGFEYFVAFSLFRQAAILAGVYRRAVEGIAADARGLEAGDRFQTTASIGWQTALKA